jgi:two-component system, OmpR family, response regulator
MPTPGSVLVVDDDPIVRELICRALQDEGLTPAAADNGRTALESAMRVPPSVLVLDVSLPVLGSAAVAAGVRELVPDVPIIVITADGRPAERARALGASAYLSKPFDLDDLVRTVREALA